MARTSQCADLLPEILRLQAQGLRQTEIAAHFGLPPYVLNAFCKRRGIRFPRGQRPKIPTDEFRALADSGLTHSQIAERLGQNRTSVERRCRRLGLKTGRTGPRFGPGHPEWEGGRAMDKHAYVRIWAPLHPQASHTGYVAEHRLVMEVVLGRYLSATETPHHIDNHPHHNWPSNLALFSNNADHLRAELTGRVKATPRSSIPGAYGNNQKIHRCPDKLETLAQCPSEILLKLDFYIDSHRPTIEHRTLSRQAIRRTGAWRPPFLPASTA